MSSNKQGKCFIPGCHSNKRNLILFSCQNLDEFVREKWSNILKPGKVPIESIKICENHFKPEDFLENMDLQQNAVPTVFTMDSKVCRFCMKIMKNSEMNPIDDILIENFEELTGEKLDTNFRNASCNACLIKIENSATVKREILEVQKKFQKIQEMQQQIEADLVPIKEEIMEYDDEIRIENSFSFSEFMDVKQETQNEYFGDDQFNQDEDEEEEEEEEEFALKAKIKLPKNKINVQCHECKNFISRFNFTIHMLRKHQGFQNFVCDFCGSLKSSKNLLISHMVAKHKVLSQYRFNCTEGDCNKSYVRKTSLQEHIKHDHLNEFDQICEICGATFKNQNLYIIHIRHKHTLEKPYHCQVDGCNSKYTSKGLLANHVRSVHKKGNYCCEICGKTFLTLRQSENHKVIHKEKKFACEYENCEKKFHTRSKLKTHQQNFHMNIKKFQCDFCLARFCQRSRAKRHIMSIHQKHLNFKCNVPDCNATYARKDFLRSHIKTHHQDIDQEFFKEILETLRNTKEPEIDEKLYTISVIE